jgi:hypothetical protein
MDNWSNGKHFFLFVLSLRSIDFENIMEVEFDVECKVIMKIIRKWSGKIKKVKS